MNHAGLSLYAYCVQFDFLLIYATICVYYLYYYYVMYATVCVIICVHCLTLFFVKLYKPVEYSGTGPLDQIRNDKTGFRGPLKQNQSKAHRQCGNNSYCI